MGTTPSSLALVRVLETELVRPPQPVAAIDVRYCSARPTTLRFKRSACSRRVRVRDITDNYALRFVTARASWRPQRHVELLDATKTRIASVGASASAELKSVYTVRRCDTTTARRRDALPLPHRRRWRRQQQQPALPLGQLYVRTKHATTDVRVDFTDVTTGELCSLGLAGSWVHRTAVLWLRSGPKRECVPVAKLYTPPPLPHSHHSHHRDEFCLSVSANVDTALLALVCLALFDRERAQ